MTVTKRDEQVDQQAGGSAPAWLSRVRWLRDWARSGNPVRATGQAAGLAARPDGPIELARQSIWDVHRTTFGYELYDRSVQQGQHCEWTEARALLHYLTLAHGAGRRRGQYLFIKCAPDSLRAEHLNLLNPSRTVLELPVLDDPRAVPHQTAHIVELQQRGFALCFDQRLLGPMYAPWRPLAAFVKIDVQAAGQRQLQAQLNTARWQTPARLIASKVETIEQFEFMKAQGASLFQGNLLGRPAPLSVFRARPRRFAVMQVAELSRKADDSARLELIVKSDPVLTYLLLVYVRACGLGCATQAMSIRAALTALSAIQLHQWAQSLRESSRPNDDGHATGDLDASVWARLMVKLAALCGAVSAEQTEKAHLVGLLSALERELGMPMSLALQCVSLPPDVVLALRDRSGQLGSLLQVAQACEDRDDEAVARLGRAVGLTEGQIMNAYLSALPNSSATI